MNRIKSLFDGQAKGLLSVYFTAGFPTLGDTRPIMKSLQDGGADIIEIGIPFSDPVADGPTIQASNKAALENGMTLELLFEQLKEMRSDIEIPVILMGYLNPVYQYGVERFAADCKAVGVDGLILPDMPLQEYEDKYKSIFDSFDLSMIFLVTPQTTEARIRKIDELSDSFIYLVSSSSITGARAGFQKEQIDYFKKMNNMELQSGTLIGFGISDRNSYQVVSEYSSGAIIGSAFINMLNVSSDISEDIVRFIRNIKDN